MTTIQFAYRGHRLWQGFYHSQKVASIQQDGDLFLPAITVNGMSKVGRGMASLSAAQLWIRKVAIECNFVKP